MLIESSAAMAASPDEVYAAVTDIDTRPLWLREISDVEPAPDGPRFNATSSLLLHRFHGASQVTHSDAPRQLVEDVHLGARFRSTWTVTPSATGSALTHRIELELPAGPLGWVARMLLGWRLRQMSRKSLRLLAVRLSSAS